MQSIDYADLYAQNQRCRSLTALLGADGGQDVQGAGRNDS